MLCKRLMIILLTVQLKYINEFHKLLDPLQQDSIIFSI